MPELGFRVCRVCLRSEPDVSLSSLFEGFGEKAEVFQLVAEIDISSDEHRNDALICDSCMRDVEEAYDLKVKILEAEQSFFATKRDTKKSNKRSNRKKVGNMQRESARLTVEIREEKESNVRSSPEKTFECQKCAKCFKLKGNLIVHIRMVHENLKRFECDLCEKSFYMKSQVVSHMKHWHRNPKCKPRDFTDSTHNPTRPFKCKFANCSKYFTRKFDVDQHEKTHVEIRQFHCRCGKAFRFKGQLKTHMKNLHGESLD